MRQTGNWGGNRPFSPTEFNDLLRDPIERLDVNQARRDVMPFIKDQQMLALWPYDFFSDETNRVQVEG